MMIAVPYRYEVCTYLGVSLLGLVLELPLLLWRVLLKLEMGQQNL